MDKGEREVRFFKATNKTKKGGEGLSQPSDRKKRGVREGTSHPREGNSFFAEKLREKGNQGGR